ncbi:hypothetical protein B0T25DRAFT_210043 [Lasiosphaeria hispida]|uniref:Transmembrane protein n=1 Tax=Lasiosphaeria hispida TaxID=260671 RepID=A0AAJ0HIL8_9PEZI|nr:hypothetical protein B0T25DRAFT_210043 [Lasiosphaeria hispida]
MRNEHHFTRTVTHCAKRRILRWPTLPLPSPSSGRSAVWGRARNEIPTLWAKKPAAPPPLMNVVYTYVGCFVGFFFVKKKSRNVIICFLVGWVWKMDFPESCGQKNDVLVVLSISIHLDDEKVCEKLPVPSPISQKPFSLSLMFFFFWGVLRECACVGCFQRSISNQRQMIANQSDDAFQKSPRRQTNPKQQNARSCEKFP